MSSVSISLKFRSLQVLFEHADHGDVAVAFISRVDNTCPRSLIFSGGLLWKRASLIWMGLAPASTR